MKKGFKVSTWVGYQTDFLPSSFTDVGTSIPGVGGLLLYILMIQARPWGVGGRKGKGSLNESPVPTHEQRIHFLFPNMLHLGLPEREGILSRMTFDDEGGLPRHVIDYHLPFIPTPNPSPPSDRPMLLVIMHVKKNPPRLLSRFSTPPGLLARVYTPLNPQGQLPPQRFSKPHQYLHSTLPRVLKLLQRKKIVSARATHWYCGEMTRWARGK